MEKASISTTSLTVNEIAKLISTLAEQYHTTVPVILERLDRASGNLDALHKICAEGDRTVEWSKDQDDLLHKNPDLLKKWKGAEEFELRKRYIAFKTK